MNMLFYKVINMSLMAGWLILAVAVARHMLKKAPKNVYYVLWGMVAIRLICPVFIESSFSLIPEQFSQVSTRQVQESLLVGQTAGVNFFMIAWIVGALVLLGYSAICYIRLYGKMCTAVRLREDIWQSEYVVTPFIFGFVKPKIYVPYGMDDDQLSMVVAHERSHVRQKDHIIKLIAFVILAVYWFNPLIWLAYILLSRDIEIACDERVVKSMSLKERKMYSEALLSLSVSKHSIAACPVFFGEVGVKMRIKRILGYKKSSLGIRVQAVAACAILGICFLSNPEKADSGKRSKSTEAKKEVAKEANSSQESNAPENATVEVAEKEAEHTFTESVATVKQTVTKEESKKSEPALNKGEPKTEDTLPAEPKRDVENESIDIPIDAEETNENLNQVARPEGTEDESTEEDIEDTEDKDDVEDTEDSEDSEGANDTDNADDAENVEVTEESDTDLITYSEVDE